MLALNLINYHPDNNNIIKVLNASLKNKGSKFY